MEHLKGSWELESCPVGASCNINEIIILFCFKEFRSDLYEYTVNYSSDIVDALLRGKQDQSFLPEIRCELNFSETKEYIQLLIF